MKQRYWLRRNVVKQSLLSLLLVFGLVGCAPGMEIGNPFEGFFGGSTESTTQGTEEDTGVDTGVDFVDLAAAEETTSESLVVEIVETPIDQLEQTLLSSQISSSQQSSETDIPSFTAMPEGSNQEFSTVAQADDPETIIIEYTNVDSLYEDANLSSFFAAGPHVLLAMRDEEEMVGIATLAPDGTLSLRTSDVIENSRPADETFVGCIDVIREFEAGAGVYGGVAFFQSVSVPGLILTPILDVNGDDSYIPTVNYVRLTDPMLVSGTCFELDDAVESVQASFVPGWNRLLREIDWRDVARGNTAAQSDDIQRTLWSVNNNSETVVKWLYSRQ